MRYGAVILALTLLAVVSGVLIRFERRGGSASGSIPMRSLAVLPQENLSGDPAQVYLADGMTDELITGLGEIGALRVISRTTAMQYKKAKKSLPPIAKELNVEAAVEGSVVRSGDRIRIAAQLFDAPDESSFGRAVMKVKWGTCWDCRVRSPARWRSRSESSLQRGSKRSSRMRTR